MDAIGVLPKRTGGCIHDDWKAYLTYQQAKHGLCNAHLVRELTDLVENYQQVWAAVMAANVIKLTSDDTVKGKPVTIKVDGGKVYINDAQVIITEILTANGVIHVIDKVILLPQ